MIYNQNIYTDIIAGYNTDPQWTLARVGCLIVTFANMLEYIGIKTDPITLHEKMKENGCFQPGGAFYISGSLSKIYPELEEQDFWSWTDEFLAEALANPKKIVILGVDFVPHTKDTEWHYVGQYSRNQIVDPNGGVIRPISTYPIRHIKILTKKTIVNNTTMNDSLIRFIQGNGGSPISKQLLVNAIQNGDTVYFDTYFPAWLLELEAERNRAEIETDVTSPEPEKELITERPAGDKYSFYKLVETHQDEIDKKKVEINQMIENKFDFNKFVVGFAKVNADKATFSASVGVLLVGLNDYFQIGLNEAVIAQYAGLVSLVLVVGGVVRQAIKS